MIIVKKDVVENHRLRRIWDWAAFHFSVIGWLLLCLNAYEASAQALPTDRFQSHEELQMRLYFKWGLIMAKAGEAQLSVQPCQYQQTPAWHYKLLFKTQGMFEKIYTMRDTLDSYFSQKDGMLLFGTKHVKENNYYLVDDWCFSYSQAKGKTFVHSKRYTPSRVKIDTMLVAEGKTYDMLAATMFLRSLDWNTLKIEESVPFHIAIGRDLVNAAFRYTGQEIIERNNAKYRTRHFYIDIFDEAFTQSKAAGEAWIGDDENHIPIKIRAKLKIGAAEVYYESAKNLKYPFDCKTDIR